MGIFFVYILKTSVCLAFFYLFYRLLLSEETFHRFNRVALLGLLALSCLIPLVEVSVKEVPEAGQPMIALEEMVAFVQQPAVFAVETASSFPWRALLLLVYVVGILFFMARHLWSLARLLRLLRACRREKMADGITLFLHREEVAPFSWMKMVVLSEDDWNENGKAILAHERAHIKNGHSWDLLLAEACVFFQWFNPAAWLLKEELQTIHEYEADEWVIRNGIDAKTYQLLLIKKAVGARLYSIANSFNHSSLKKRITMMIKKKSNPWARLKYAYVLPLATVAVAAFARPEVSNELEEISSAKINELTSIVETNEVKSVEISSDEKIKVSGNVLDAETKEPVPGVSVIERNTSNGTLTDIDGNFEMEVSKGSVLMLSFVGKQTQTVVVKDASPLKVLMKKGMQSLEEITVVGYAAEEEQKPVKKEEVAQEPQERVIFRVVEQQPEFPGGMKECMKFLGRNIKYPVEAQKARIEGRVIVQFVVERDGSISDVKTMRGVSPELDAEAIRVVSMMPKWNPGKQRGKKVAVAFCLPITFKLQSPAPAEKDAAQADADAVKNLLKDKGNYAEAKVMDIRGAEKRPLIVVDGKVMGNEPGTLAKIAPDQIESITVVKDQAGISLYGDKAKDGVILITLKKEKK